MHVGTPSTASEYTLYDTSVGQRVPLAEADYERDLGVWISGDLKPSIHCYKADKKVICKYFKGTVHIFVQNM